MRPAFERRLRELDRSIELYDRFIELTEDPQLVPPLLFRIATIEEGRGDLEAAFARFQSLRDAPHGRASLGLAATVRQARLRAQQGDDRAALALYESASEQFGEGELLFDEQTAQPSSWEREPGWRLADREAILEALPFAAEARFRRAEVDVATCQAISLDYPEGRWRVLARNLTARAEALQAAERALIEVIWMGDAAWSVAATMRIGELYKKFYDDMYALPQFDLDECLNDGFGYDACDEADATYNDMLYEQMAPIEAKTREFLQQAIAMAHDNGVYNEWTRRAVERIAEVDRSLRVVGEEGVEPIHTGAFFYRDSLHDGHQPGAGAL